MYGIKQSFSRVGMPGDNAWAESFFATGRQHIFGHKIKQINIREKHVLF
jgi:transposase InsO family protein